MVVGNVGPLLLVVASLTLVAKLPLMLVILLVASNTGGCELGLVNWTFLRKMASVALDLLVLAL